MCICIILSQLSEISIAYLIKTAKNCIFMVTLYKDGKLHMILMKAISKSFKSGIPLHDSCHGIPLNLCLSLPCVTCTAERLANIAHTQHHQQDQYRCRHPDPPSVLERLRVRRIGHQCPERWIILRESKADE